MKSSMTIEKILLVQLTFRSLSKLAGALLLGIMDTSSSFQILRHSSPLECSYRWMSGRRLGVTGICQNWNLSSFLPSITAFRAWSCLVMSVHKRGPSYTTIFQDKRSLRYAHTYTISIDLT